MGRRERASGSSPLVCLVLGKRVGKPLIPTERGIGDNASVALHLWSGFSGCASWHTSFSFRSFATVFPYQLKPSRMLETSLVTVSSRPSSLVQYGFRLRRWSLFDTVLAFLSRPAALLSR
ncbi:hypothetical protein BaRGS_00025303 [Batillaria attramentaria]|uniref:Uncharacterized protein n=1 Tax=Batillaria attramentaria TaxID=370345 RepID=A0ABD0K8R6_9CAEN